MKSSILKNKNFKIIEICFICIVILIFGSGLIFRHTILSSVINKKIRNFNQKFHAQLNIKDFEFTGLTEINFNNISLAPNNGDTLMKIDSLNAQISFWRLLVFNISLNKLEIKNIDFHFVRHDSLTNYMFLFEKNKDSLENINKQQTINYAERVQSLFETIFHSIPSTVRFTNVNISADLNNKKFSFYTKQFVIEDKLFETIIKLNNEDQITEWILKGRLDASDHSAQFKLFASDHKRIIIPYIDQKWNAHIGFDTLQFSLKNIEEDYNLISFNGSLSLDNFIINQPRIGQEDVFFKHGHIDYKINITKDYLEIDSASHFVFNKLEFNPYFKYRPRPSKQITLILNKSRFNAQDFFESLPAGLFKNLEGIKTKGELGYHLKFYADLDKPDSLIFESDLKSYKFRIEKFGNTNFTFINQPFQYTAYEKGIPVRTFEIGPGNPNFRNIDQIPEFLKKSIITSEDGGFYYHRGFLLDAFRESIITNIKEKRFARGGSTITMQLVKNVFLNRNKTITRKVEEAIIVWLIENCGLSTKDRLYEVYLNILEMGPMVYGVNEGAHFYFNKDVSKLTLAESLYLASIVPRPKYFKYSFDENGNLRSYLAAYFKFCSQKMLHKEYISQNDFDNLVPNVELKGPAKAFVLPKDSVPADSLEYDYQY